MINYKLLKKIFLSLLKFSNDNFIFLFIKNIRNKTYLGEPKYVTFHIWWEFSFFKLVTNQIILTFPISQKILFPI